MAGERIVLGPNNTIQGKSPFLDPIEIEFNPGGSADSVANPPGLQTGVPSLFNPYAVVVFPSTGEKYNQLIDGNSSGVNFSPGYNSGTGKPGNPTISMLVEDSELSKKTPYYYTDFLYCKYVGKIPNNQLITLRRYPAPTYDSLATPAENPNAPSEPTSTNNSSTSNTTSTNNNSNTGNTSTSKDQIKEFFPIAQAVTWFGEETGNKLSDILSFSVNINWKVVEADVNTVSGNEQGSEDSPLPGVAKLLGVLTGNVNSPLSTANSQYDPYNNGPYAHRVYGPVNVISKVYKRDRGLDFKQAITLNFEYSLKSIGNINPKAAMLDLMSNLLSLTYNNAAFWGGANRYFPQKPTYPFLGGTKGMYSWYRGDPVGFTRAVGEQFSAAKDSLMNVLGKLAEDPISTLKGLAVGAAKLGMIEMGKGRAPSIVPIKALLTGEPVGEWHLVIGNPFSPLAMIGNLVCTESKFQFNDIIGADNFPTELKVTITVEHGRPRDKGDIESIFNQGQGRIYYASKGAIDVLNKTSATKNSKNDTSWKKGSNGGETLYARTGKSAGLFTGSQSDYDQILGSIKGIGRDGSESANAAWKLADRMFLRAAGSQTNSSK